MPRELTSPNHILCEGEGDSGFLTALARHHNVPGFETTLIADGGFESKLGALQPIIDRGVIRRVLLVADNDSNPHASVQAIQQAMRRKHYPVPGQPLQVRGGDDFKVGIVMLPGTDVVGNLESLLLRDVRTRHAPLIACAEAFAACELNGQPDNWSRGHRDKMLLRSAIAARVENDPNCSLSFIWSKAQRPVQIDSNEFTWVADFMRDPRKDGQ